MVNDEVEEEINLIMLLIESVKKKKIRIADQNINGKLSFDTSEFWSSFRKHKLGMIGLSIFLMMIFFALTADIFAPYSWEYPGMDLDNGSIPGSGSGYLDPYDTDLFLYLSPPDAPQIAATGLDAPDSIRFAYETDVYVEPDLNHAHFIYAMCPFNLSAVESFEPTLVNFSVTLSIDEEESTGLTEGGFMVQVVVGTDVVANWTGLNHDPVNLADYLIPGPNNNIRLNIIDISPNPIKIVVDWSPITWREGNVERSLGVNDTVFLARYHGYGYNITGWKYLDSGIVRTLSDVYEYLKAELSFVTFYGLPPFSTGRSGGFHLLGTDYLGHDILTGLIYGMRVAFIVSFIAIAISTAIGIGLGILLDKLGIRSLEVFKNLPQQHLLRLRVVFLVLVRLNLLIILFSFLQSMIQASDAWGALIILAVGFGITDWGGMAILAQNQLLSSKEQFNPRETVLKALPAIAFGIAEVIFLDVLICFLGLGHPGTPAWGRMLQLSQAGLQYAWWPALFPVLAIAFTILGFILLGYGLREVQILLGGKEAYNI
ncbi:MAG: ABC transporter permease [Promethearchaeota archaeon]